MDIKNYSLLLSQASKNLKLEEVLKLYALTNSDEIHNMICEAKSGEGFSDSALYEQAESIDYFKYEKELWKLNNHSK